MGTASGIDHKIEIARQAARTAVEKRGEYLTMACPIILNTWQMLSSIQARKDAETVYIAAMLTAAEILNTLTSEELAAASGTLVDRRNIGAVLGWEKVKEKPKSKTFGDDDDGNNRD